MHPVNRSRRRGGAALLAAAAAAAATTLGTAPLQAQQPLGQSALGQSALAEPPIVGRRLIGVSPRVEFWSFADGLDQVTPDDSLRLDGVRMISVPVTAVIPLGQRFTFDVATSWASGEVELADAAAGAEDSYSLSGFSDTRLRLTGRFLNDNVILTLGYDAPTGATELDADELAAARVLGAPALAFATRPFGTGGGGTAGLVFARQFGGVAWAAGASYEIRQGYSPVGGVGNLPVLDFDPSDALHLSVAADGVVGNGAMTLVLGADIFGDAEVRTGVTSGSGVIPPNTSRLGPILSAEWQWRFGSTRWRDLTLTVVDRYRTGYEQEGEEVEGGSANYLEGALRGTLPLGTRTGLVTGLEFRHHTGLDADRSLAGAAFVGGGATLGLAFDMGGGYVLQPFVQGQLGRFELDQTTSNATGFGAGIVLGTRF